MNIENNRLDVSIDQADLDAGVQHVADAKALFPFLIGLSADEKKGMVGINVSNKQFVEDCIHEMNQDSSLLPSFISVANVENDYKLYLDLDIILAGVRDLVGQLSDTQFLAGAEAYNVCLIYYSILKAAARAGLPGAQDKYDRLKDRFENQGPGDSSDSDGDSGGDDTETPS